MRMYSVAIVACALAVSARPAHTQTICRPADAETSTLKLDIGRYSAAVSGDGKVVRDSLKIPFVPVEEITVVTQEATCKKASAALKSLFANTGNNTLSGRVYVLQVGSAYAVVDPAYRHDASLPVGPILFVDSRFKPLSTTF